MMLTDTNAVTDAKVAAFRLTTLARHRFVREELSMDCIADYPNLARTLEVWQKASRCGLPERLDVCDLPKQLLPYIMLLDLEPDALRFRLAGTRFCDLHGSELSGKTADVFFLQEQAEDVLETARVVTQTKKPSLARRSYISLHGRYWTYVRLLLPLASRPSGNPALFKAAEPKSLTNTGSVEGL